jgi:uncharacterized membrane protein
MGFLVIAFIIILITYLVVKLIRSNKAVSKNHTIDFLNLLKIRFANGAITMSTINLLPLTKDSI